MLRPNAMWGSQARRDELAGNAENPMSIRIIGPLLPITIATSGSILDEDAITYGADGLLLKTTSRGGR